VENQGELSVPVEQTKQSIRESNRVMAGLFVDLTRSTDEFHRENALQQISDVQQDCEVAGFSLIEHGINSDDAWSIHPVVERLPDIIKTVFSRHPDVQTVEQQQMLMQDLYKETVHVSLDNGLNLRMPEVSYLSEELGPAFRLSAIQKYIDSGLIVDMFASHHQRHNLFELPVLDYVRSGYGRQAVETYGLSKFVIDFTTANRLSRNQLSHVVHNIQDYSFLFNEYIQEEVRKISDEDGIFYAVLSDDCYPEMSLIEKIRLVRQFDRLMPEVLKDLGREEMEARQRALNGERPKYQPEPADFLKNIEAT
jgi:hypothetical protein